MKWCAHEERSNRRMQRTHGRHTAGMKSGGAPLIRKDVRLLVEFGFERLCVRRWTTLKP